MKEEKKFYSPQIFPPDYNMNKVWFVYYYEPLAGGLVAKRVRVYGGINRLNTVKERLKKAKEITARIIKERPVTGRKKVTRSILLSTVGHHTYSISIKSYCTYLGMCKKFITFLKGKPESAATRDDAILFLASLKAKGLSPRTIKSYRNNIKAVYNRYIEDENNDFKNPFSNIKLPPSQSRSLYYFNDSQISRIKEYAQADEPALWLAIQLLYYCFIRPNELRQLKAENINVNGGFIEVPGDIAKNKKTQKVAIPTPLVDALLFASDLDPERYLFGNNNNQPPKRDHFSKLHKKVLDKLGIKGRYGFYSWKHTGVVKAVKSGIHIKDLQLQLRHHSLDMVNEYLKNLGVLDCDRIRDLFPAI